MTIWERLEQVLARYVELEAQMADPTVIADTARYTAIVKEHGCLKHLAGRYQQYKQLDAKMVETEALMEAESDPEMKQYAAEELADLRRQKDELQHQLQEQMLSGAEDADRSLIMEVRAGTGGEEAALFARDLFEMYTRYAEKRGWKTEVMAANPTDLGGFREVVFSVEGEGAFRELQFESGGHRVQRVPKTETQGRIHTSAATVAVLPEPHAVEIDIRDEDLETQTFRASGPGGQHVNKTSSAVRIIHHPSGLVVSCQDEKSQHKNRAKAMRVLRSRLYDKMMREQRDQRSQLRRSLVGSGDRSQRIRTYNFPQNRVSDHRISLNLYCLDSIMLGELHELIEGLLAYDREQQLGQLLGRGADAGGSPSA